MRLVFIRHGKDDGNYRGGWSDLDLIDEGKEQAKKLSEYLKKEKDNFKISKFIVSDLPRTMTTATIANQYLKVPIETEPLIREMNNGDLAGMLNEDALVKYPGLFYNTLGMDEKYPNGESPIDFYNRIKNWFDKEVEKYKGIDDTYAVVTHSGVINIIYHIIKKKDWSNKVKSYKVGNCSIHILNLDTMKFELENYREFLD